MKYIVVTGGVISGIGKGITSSSIGALFQSLGYTVTMLKIDPYLNVDSGTLSPMAHGECFVLADGSECDLDLGNYERFLNVNLLGKNNITTGSVYASVISKERKGEYLGATVQIVPHITDEIILNIQSVSQTSLKGKTPDICIIEVGGTIGDIEVLPFINAIQQMSNYDDDKFCFVHVAMTITQNDGEIKTKPIQHSVSQLQSQGIFPNILVVRSKQDLDIEVKHKLQQLCHMKVENIITNPDVKSIYHVTGNFHSQKICHRIAASLGLNIEQNLEDPHKQIVLYHDNIIFNPHSKVYQLGIIGKYTDISDTYLSLSHAILHAAFNLGIKVNCNWIDSSKLENSNDDNIRICDGFIIPGGFGSRGIKGKAIIAQYARLRDIPLLGICLGMQVMAVESVNEQLRLIDSEEVAISSEWLDGTGHFPLEAHKYLNVVDILANQTNILGGTMRKGNYTTTLLLDSLKHLHGNVDTIVERHRHRYEVTRDSMKLSTLSVAGVSLEDPNLVEIICDRNSKFYVGCQYHPEYTSRMSVPHPLFTGLLSAMIN